ncbi:hypothetical protein ALC57_02697 [Trachymyrmex cornetzi]|uniref:MADF domain-containing protein n=1 Tax=Trachymyrmex cornetzi TaxID=471704 RepID=A0A151JNV1_9HYME|nr:hypothetical protein ALC57_02697 [Trachymyrmex cornetzi]
MADGTEAVVVTNTPRKKVVNSQHDSRQVTDFEANKLVMVEQLIDEVSRRPALWNFKLPLTERSPQIKKKLWEEVFTALGGTYSIDSIKKKWKSLSDSFRIYSKKEQAASGSAAPSGRRPWIHLQRMNFLRDLQLQSKYTYINDNNTNYYNIDSDCNDSMDMASSICDNSNSSSSIGKRRLSEDSALDRIADSLALPISFNMDQVKQMLPPAQAALDKPTIIGNMIAQLREIDPELHDEITLQLLKVTIDAKRKT